MAMIFVLLTSGIAAQTSASLMAPLQLSTRKSSFARHSDCHSNNQPSLLSQLNDIRGGGDSDDSPPPGTYNYGAHQQQQQQPAQTGSPNFQFASSVPPTMATGQNSMDGTGGVTSNHPNYQYRETVEDRIDAWRKQQQQLQQTQSAEEAASAVDDQGRFKLFTAVSRVSVSFFFFILMWRTVHHYELADATFGSGRGTNGVGLRAALVRTVVVTPLVVLFLGEMMGAVLGMMGGDANTSSTSKKRLKGILNLHKFVELVMLVYNVIRLAIWPSKYVMREVYIGRTISNFFFFMQSQLYTKLSWGEVSKSPIGEGGYATESYYDDYTPDMAGNYADDFSSWQPPTDGGEYYNGQDASSPQQQQQQQQYQQNYADNSNGNSQ